MSGLQIAGVRDPDQPPSLHAFGTEREVKLFNLYMADSEHVMVSGEYLAAGARLQKE